MGAAGVNAAGSRRWAHARPQSHGAQLVCGDTSAEVMVWSMGSIPRGDRRIGYPWQPVVNCWEL